MDIKPSQQLILEYLAKCKFLTVSQMMALGIKNDRANLNRELKALRERDKAPIAHKNFGADPVEGKLESVHYLTAAGEKLLQEHTDIQFIRRPIGDSTLFYKDYKHRKNTIDIQVALLQQEAQGKGELRWFEAYFDQEGNNRSQANARSKTKIVLSDGRFLIADAVAVWDNYSHYQAFALEMYNGKDTGRVERALWQHAIALSEGLLVEKLQAQFPTVKGYQVLCVFEQESCLRAVWQRLAQNPEYENFKGYFLAKTLAEIQQRGFFGQWQSL